MKYTRNIDIRIDGITNNSKKVTFRLSIGDSPFMQDFPITLKLETGNPLALLKDTANFDEKSISFLSLSESKFSSSDKFVAFDVSFYDIAANLNKSANYVLFKYIIPNLEYGDDAIIIDSIKVKSEQKKFYKGLPELKKKNILSSIKGVHRGYYINVNYIRYGNRMSYVKNYLNASNFKQVKALFLKEIKRQL